MQTWYQSEMQHETIFLSFIETCEETSSPVVSKLLMWKEGTDSSAQQNLVVSQFLIYSCSADQILP